MTEVKQEMSSISAVWANVLSVFLCLQQRGVKEQAAALAALEGSDDNTILTLVTRSLLLRRDQGGLRKDRRAGGGQELHR